MNIVSIGIVGAGLRGRMFAESLREQLGVQVLRFAEPSAPTAETTRLATGLPVFGSHVELPERLNSDAGQRRAAHPAHHHPTSFRKRCEEVLKPAVLG